MNEAINKIIESFKTRNLAILQAPPGTGKTTRVPPGLRAYTQKQIWVLEPRRIAAKLAADFIASQLNQNTGQDVGYRFRQEFCGTSATQIWFMTEGMLLKMAQTDPQLQDVQVIILDEFHERHQQTDATLAYCRHLQRTSRPDLKILVMSATLDQSNLKSNLPEAEIIEVPAPTHPVTIEHRPELADRAIEAVRHTLSITPKGHILVFLPSLRMMQDWQRQLEGCFASFLVTLIHGSFSRKEQELALSDQPRRKIILSTNVCESSLTVPGVRAVIDLGLHREIVFKSASGAGSLETKDSCQASIIQRTGRAGREAPGYCLRLFSESSYKSRLATIIPEIRRTDLTDLILNLMCLVSPEPVEALPWVEALPPGALTHGRKLLLSLGAIQLVNDQMVVTQIGRQMANLSLSARGARALLAASPTARPKILHFLIHLLEGNHNSGAADSWAELPLPLGPARLLADQIRRQLSRTASSQESLDFLPALAKGWPDRLGFQKNNIVTLVSGQSLKGPKSVGALPQFMLALEDHQGFLKNWLAVEPSLLWDHPELQTTAIWEWDNSQRRLWCQERWMVGSVCLEESKKKADPQDPRALIAFLNKIDFANFPTTHQYYARLKLCQSQGLLSDYPEELSFETFQEQVLAPALERAQLPELSLKALEDHIDTVIAHGIDEKLGSLVNQLTPTKVTLTNQKNLSVHYSTSEPPFVESRLQDFWGQKKPLTILGGKVRLTIKLLAPNKRPVQVTQDLESFWAKTYPELRGALSRRYPKHHWP